MVQTKNLGKFLDSFPSAFPPPLFSTAHDAHTGLGPSQDPCLLLLAGDYATDRLCDPGKAEPRSWPWAADGAGPPRAHRAGPPGALRGSVPLNFVFP